MRHASALALAGCLALFNVGAGAQEPAGDKRELTPEEVKANIGRMGDSIVVDPSKYEFSAAERALWMSDHLSNIKAPVRLRYDFSSNGVGDPGWKDVVTLDVVAVNKDGTKDTRLEFFTGDRKQFVPNENQRNVIGNPVLGTYMQGDVNGMQHWTGGNWRYFLSRVKTALAQKAQVAPTKFDFGGRQVEGETIVVTPYVDDQNKAQLKDMIHKRYEFTFSPQVPGSLYRIHTVVPNPAPGQPPLIEEVLIFRGADKRG
ncbi:MAG: hypothetical protein AB7Q97_02620 [Gammaproteobacteria bacterium]